MAQEYVLCDKQNELGVIALSKNVFETIAAITLDEFEEIKKDVKNRKNVDGKIKENQLNLYLEIKLKFGANVNQVTQMLQEKIYRNILEMTGFKCQVIDIKVVGFDI